MSIKTKSYEAIPTHEFPIDGQEKGLLINKGPFFGKRHWLVLTLALLSQTLQSVKVYMTVCVIAMTDPMANINKNIPTYNWKNTGIILAAFVWGMCSSQMFAGWLMTKFKPKWPIVLSVIICSIMGFLTPTVAEYIGSVGVIICRVIQGFTIGSLSPFFNSLYGKWIPPCEMSRLIAVVASGTHIGIISSMFLSGLLAASKYGWPLVMYFYSSLFLIWCLIFIYVSSNSPSEHSTISMEEKLYIEHSLSQVQKKKLIPPYKKIFTSLCVWATIISRIGGYFSFYTILSEISTYLKDILNIDIKSNGLFSALPYICTLFCIHLFGYLSDLLIVKSIFSKTTARKTMALIGCVLPSSCLILLGYCESGQTLKIIILLSVMVSIDNTGFLHSTLINAVDLSPNHSGTLEGIINQISLITASGGPLLVQFFVSEKKSHAEWRIIFYTVAIVKILTVLMFLIWGSAETQSWNDEICETKTDLPEQKNQKREIDNTC